MLRPILLLLFINSISLFLIAQSPIKTEFTTPSIQRMDSLYQQLFKDYQGDFDQLEGTGIMPFTRLKSFYEARVLKTGELSDKDRLQIFQKVILDQAENKNGSPVANWQNLGPSLLVRYNGRLASHAFDLHDKDRVWIGSASGGLWLTEDSGDSWTPKTDNIPSTGIGAIVIKPDDNNTLLIGTGEGYSPTNTVIKPGIGILKSTDGGNTWLPTSFSYSLGAQVSILRMAWHPTNTNEVWAAATNGLWKSTDEGINWTLVMGDGTNHANFICNDIIIQKNDPSILFTAFEGKGVFKSTNGGQSFQQLTNGLPTSDMNIIRVSQCESEPNVLYTSIIRVSNFSLHGVFKTTDNGESWTKLTSAPNAPCSPQFVNFCQGWYNNFVTVSPYDPDHVFFGGVTMWESRSGGLFWTQKDRLICTNCIDPPACTMWADHHDFGFSPHDSLLLYSLNDGGVAISTDGGQCFEDKNDGLVTSQFISATASRINPDILTGGLQDHGIHAVDVSNGLEWYKWAWFDGADVEIHSNDPSIFYGTWIDGTYWKFSGGSQIIGTQINSGMNLNENTSTFYAPLAIHPENGNILLGATQQKLYRSSNGGLSWTPVLTGSLFSDFRFSEANPSIAYATSWNGTSWSFYRSEDAGNTWTTTNSAPGWRVTDIKTSALDENVIFATRNSINAATAHVYKSVDGGNSWLPIQGNLPDITTNAFAVDFTNDDILYVGTDLGVFISTNGGIEWSPYNDGLPITYVYDIEYNPTDSTLVVGTLGRGVWRTKAYTNDVTSTTSLATPKLDFKVFPNPTSDEIQVQIEDIERENIKVSLLNILGQKMSTLFEGQVGQNSFKANYSLRKWAKEAGVYFIQIQYQNRAFTTKIVLQ